MSVRKRGSDFTLRRSSRDRHAHYKSLDENIMGIRRESVLFQQILDQVDDRRRHYSARTSSLRNRFPEDDDEDDGGLAVYSNARHYRTSGRHHLRSAPISRGGRGRHHRRIMDEDDEEEVEDEEDQEDDDAVVDEVEGEIIDSVKDAVKNKRGGKKTLTNGCRAYNGVSRELLNLRSRLRDIKPHSATTSRNLTNGYQKSTRLGSKDSHKKGTFAVSAENVNGDDEQQFSPTMYERVKNRRQSANAKTRHGNKHDDELNDELNYLLNDEERSDDDGDENDVGEEQEDEKPKRSIRARKTKTSNVEDEEIMGEMEDEEPKIEEEDDDSGGRPYRLRQRRTQVTRFDHKRDFPRSCRASSIYGGALSAALVARGGARRGRFECGEKAQRRFRRRRPRFGDRNPSSSSTGSSLTSSPSSDDDERIRTAHNDLKEEARFERRKLRSLQKGRLSFMPTNITEKDLKSAAMDVRQKLRSTNHSCADIDPMEVDVLTGFNDIGGLNVHIQSLKEIVVFPLLYPELFKRFDVTPPKGVLFYGPPGTGKTLVARALSNECSRGDKKVAFFMRKGADCMSKWVGESERQLRLLFDQAYSMRPSIIFFDEIDGLAPVRSSRQDQIHSSIVSTLLALMDGLDKRGEIIVIGATNRLDSIDPALRRPGRFDREMRFDLPDVIARDAILHIHTRTWKESRPDEKVYKWLAEQTSGYCGADLRALCTEAVLIALRERFPHIYLSADKLLIDVLSVRVDKCHFEDAMRFIVPAARRDFSVISHQVNPRLSCFIDPVIAEVLERLPAGYAQRRTAETLWGGDGVASELQRVVMALKVPPSVPAGRLLLHGNGFLGQSTHFLPVLTNYLDHLPVFSLACEQIFAQGHADENVAQVVRSALRATARGTPVVLLIPDLDALEATLPSTAWRMLMSSMNAFSGFTSALVLASSHDHFDNCSEDVRRLFRRHEAFEILPPNALQRATYFRRLLDACAEPPFVFDASKCPCPPKVSADVPVRKVSAEEYKTLKQLYEQMLRQFRIFLRDLLGRLVRDRRFNLFNLPVDKEDAEDYYDIIKKPMCLSQMMERIDLQTYTTKLDFMADIRLIRDNAIEYNPNRLMEEKLIRHNAHALVDMADALFETDVDSGLCKKIEEVGKLLEEAKKTLEVKDDASLGVCEPSTSAAVVATTAAPVKQIRFSTDSNGEASTKLAADNSFLADKISTDNANDMSTTPAANSFVQKNRKRRRRGGYSFKPMRRRLSSSIVRKYKTICASNSNEEIEDEEDNMKEATRKKSEHNSSTSQFNNSTFSSNDEHNCCIAAKKTKLANENEKISNGKISVCDADAANDNYGNLIQSTQNSLSNGGARVAVSNAISEHSDNDCNNSKRRKQRSDILPHADQHESKRSVLLDANKLEKVVNMAVLKTSAWYVPDIECLGAQLAQRIDAHRSAWDRLDLPARLAEIVQNFQL